MAMLVQACECATRRQGGGTFGAEHHFRERASLSIHQRYCRHNDNDSGVALAQHSTYLAFGSTKKPTDVGGAMTEAPPGPAWVRTTGGIGGTDPSCPI